MLGKTGNAGMIAMLLAFGALLLLLLAFVFVLPFAGVDTTGMVTGATSDLFTEHKALLFLIILGVVGLLFYIEVASSKRIGGFM